MYWVMLLLFCVCVTLSRATDDDFGRLRLVEHIAVSVKRTSGCCVVTLNTVWRLQLCADLEGMITKFAEVRRVCCMSMSSSSCGFL
jgi:hypothetical protein